MPYRNGDAGMEVITGRPPMHPHECAVFPFPHINLDPNMRYVDCGVYFEQGGWKEQLYLSEPAVKEVARLLGFPTRDEHTLALAELARVKAENEDIRAQLAAADAELDQISHLKARGYQAVKRVGRPPAKKAA